MNRFIFFSLLIGLSIQVNAQTQSTLALNSYENFQSRQLGEVDSLPVNILLAPFYHGVASGDPLTDKVIIWTRITTVAAGPVSVDWAMALDSGMTNIVQRGQFTTDISRDYTVKVDVEGLEAGQTYYYQFSTPSAKSIVGRTKTAPSSGVEHLKFAIVSCSNYPRGYFNAYDRVGARNDLDAVIHLGDYIYESPRGSSNNFLDDRKLFPRNETVTLTDYRTRYSLYHLDPQSMRAHQQHPFICVWDDHESANNSYKDGAIGHQEDEGLWEDRKRAAKKAYFEWLPIRDNPDTVVYRNIHYGDLAEIIMLDTRLEGREEQLNDVNHPELLDSARTILGEEQRNWFLSTLSQSTAKWKVVGTQVIFSPFNVGFIDNSDPDSVESLFLDIWDGYPAERDSIISFLENQSIDNVVFAAGDLHISFGHDVNTNPTDTSSYDPSTGRGSVAVEFVTPSISTPNFDEFVGALLTDVLSTCLYNPCPVPFQSFTSPNPHIKFADLGAHGYYILDLKPDSAQANWYFLNTTQQVDTLESFATGLYTYDSENHLRTSANPSAPKEIQDIPAPPIPQMITSNSPILETQPFVILSAYPNPTSDFLVLQYALNQPQNFEIEVLSLAGALVNPVIKRKQGIGIYTLTIDVRSLARGAYLLNVKAQNQQQQLKFLVR